MKAPVVFASALALGLGSLSQAQETTTEPAVPVQTAPAGQVANPPPAEPTASQSFEYEQRLYGPTHPQMIPPEKANEIVQNFRATYEKLGKPRILFYVNRELVDANTGLKLTGRRESTVATANGAATGNATPTHSATVSGENTYTASPAPASSLTDRLTTREIERLFGRPFRAAGVTIADQKVASALIADQPIDHFTVATNESARKDREALAKVADVVVEVLVSSRTVTQNGISSEQSMVVPDIEVTAIRLSDAAVLGQASSSDVLGKGQAAAEVARQYDPREITEATALALMEDMSGNSAK